MSGSGGYNDTNPLQASNFRKPVMYYIMQGRITEHAYPETDLPGRVVFRQARLYGLEPTGHLTGAFHSLVVCRRIGNGHHPARAQYFGWIEYLYKFDRYVWNATGQYVTGAHQVKFGIGSSYGPAYQNFLFNGDGVSQFHNGVPFQFLAEDSPIYEKVYLNNDLGIYGQDTWTFKRVSITAGLRWEYLNNDINPQSAPAGTIRAGPQLPADRLQLPQRNVMLQGLVSRALGPSMTCSATTKRPSRQESANTTRRWFSRI